MVVEDIFLRDPPTEVTSDKGETLPNLLSYAVRIVVQLKTMTYAKVPTGTSFRPQCSNFFSVKILQNKINKKQTEN